MMLRLQVIEADIERCIKFLVFINLASGKYADKFHLHNCFPSTSFS